MTNPQDFISPKNLKAVRAAMLPGDKVRIACGRLTVDLFVPRDGVEIASNANNDLLVEEATARILADISKGKKRQRT